MGDSTQMRRVAVLGAMANELRPFVKLLPLRPEPWGSGTIYRGTTGNTEVLASITGIGMTGATQTTERMLAEGRIDQVIMMGIAGGLDPSLVIGDLVVPEVVLDGATGREYHPTPVAGHPNSGTLHSSDTMVMDPDALTALAERGVVALDMETAALAAVCEQADVAWLTFRAISDTVADGIVNDSVLGLTNPDGSPNLPAVARFMITRPSKIGQLVKLGRDAGVATSVAARAAAAACIGS
jgi:adenosylhomocysteine nucleosidase